MQLTLLENTGKPHAPTHTHTQEVRKEDGFQQEIRSGLNGNGDELLIMMGQESHLLFILSVMFNSGKYLYTC